MQELLHVQPGHPQSHTAYHVSLVGELCVSGDFISPDWVSTDLLEDSRLLSTLIGVGVLLIDLFA